MQGLFVRLSGLDDGAAAALRVIEFFDRLLERRCSPAVLVRSAAALAECIVGLTDPLTRQEFRFTAEGIAVPVAEQAPTSTRGVSGVEDARVWLERAGGPHPLDTMILERMSLAASVTLARRQSMLRPRSPDPALLELGISPGTDQVERVRALRLLGFRSDLPVMAVSGAVTHRKAITAALQSSGVPVPVVCATELDQEAVALVQGVPTDQVVATLRETGMFAGVGSAVPLAQATTSWNQARTALRLARSRLLADDPAAGAVLAYHQAGVLMLLAEILTESAKATADVHAIDCMRAGAREALEALCRTGSQRRAAIDLNLHRSSVGQRLVEAQGLLGFPLDAPAGLFRARLGLIAWSLAESPSRATSTSPTLLPA